MTIPPLDWNAPQTWLLGVLVLALLVMPFWLISQQRGVGSGRKAVRLVLHGLLWLTVLGLWLQPRWQQTLPSGKLLLAADNVPDDSVRAVAARLKIQTTLSATAFRGLKTMLPVDTVWIVGQDFREGDLARLARQAVTWIPYNVPGQLQQLHWKGIVRLGERQTVTGKINTPEAGMLQLCFGQRTVDSIKLAAGNQVFNLSYVAFSQGRTPLTLRLGKTVLDTIRFVARPAEKLRVRFVLDAPDFETRALADWLGQQGNIVELTNRLSTGIGSELTINKPATNVLPDLVITDPANVDNALVNKALAAGKSVLVLNLSRPDADMPTINRALRTSLQVRRILGKDTIRISADLTALPFRFQSTAPAARPGTLSVTGYPVMVQSATAGSRVAVSLLAETFPLRLSGDSAAYARLWLAVLAPLRPVGQDNIQVDAPVQIHQPVRFKVNNARTTPARLRVGADTLTLQPDPINTRAYEATGRFATVGWLPVQDTLAVYAYGNASPANGVSSIAQREQIASWVRAHRRYDAAPNQSGRVTARTIEKAIPDWEWLLVIGLLLSALWLEPKLG